MHTPRLLRFISWKYSARWWAWRCRSPLGPGHTRARVAGRVAHSTLMLSEPRPARKRPATGPAQFVVTSRMRIPCSGPADSSYPFAVTMISAAAGGVVPDWAPIAGAGPRRDAGVAVNL